MLLARHVGLVGDGAVEIDGANGTVVLAVLLYRVTSSNRTLTKKKILSQIKGLFTEF